MKQPSSFNKHALITNLLILMIFGAFIYLDIELMHKGIYWLVIFIGTIVLTYIINEGFRKKTEYSKMRGNFFINSEQNLFTPISELRGKYFAAEIRKMNTYLPNERNSVQRAQVYKSAISRRIDFEERQSTSILRNTSSALPHLEEQSASYRSVKKSLREIDPPFLSPSKPSHSHSASMKRNSHQNLSKKTQSSQDSSSYNLNISPEKFSQRKSSAFRLALITQEEKAQEFLRTCSHSQLRSHLALYIDNCSKWMFESILPLIFNELFNNYSRLSSFLLHHRGTPLYEFALIGNSGKNLNSNQNLSLNLNSNKNEESSQTFVSIEEIFHLQRNQCLLSDFLSSMRNINSQAEFVAKREEFLKLVSNCQFMEKFIQVNSMNSSRRIHVIRRLQSLANSPENCFYNEICSSNHKPSDTEIIANIFFVSINSASFVKENGIHRSLVIDQYSRIQLNKKDDIYFQQVNSENLEPHFNLLTYGETFHSLPV